MKNELLRLKRSGLLYILIILPLLVCLLLSFYYQNNEVDINSIDLNNLESYSSISDINTLINTKQNALLSLDEISDEYQIITKELMVYNYLKDNYIPYENLVEASFVKGVVDDPLFFNNWYDVAILILYSVISLVFSIFMFNIDFIYKTHLSLYTSKKTFCCLVKEKFLLYITIIISGAILLKLVGNIFYINSNYGKEYIVFIGNTVTNLKSSVYVLLHSISMIIGIGFISSIIFFVSILNRNLYLALIINLLIIGVFGFAFRHLIVNFSIFTTVFEIYKNTVNINTTILAMIIKIIIPVVLAVISIKTFRKRDLI